MPLVQKRHDHFFYGVIQSCLTTGITAFIASLSYWGTVNFMMHWAGLWLLSWVAMLPVVVFAAPFIRRITDRLTDSV
ncbi:DUF2798 domain-containing protein (plasmid) [Cupriavidus pinatubonensis]|uniref:DUF2798 domain-containing protein n=1 Tax=Cupriavidus pinatubonensis TaxID=248026 RepID=UPI001C739EBD|nr:DUF2798 domain-containing protein [Cupriavidus pinatubonensis]QYY34233.1 DUF2798 domain-containing protein [Cupriavidus pinatubonensis]